MSRSGFYWLEVLTSGIFDSHKAETSAVASTVLNSHVVGSHSFACQCSALDFCVAVDVGEAPGQLEDGRCRGNGCGCA